MYNIPERVQCHAAHFVHNNYWPNKNSKVVSNRRQALYKHIVIHLFAHGEIKYVSC